MSDALLQELDGYDFPDTEYVPEGYDMKSVPKASTANMEKLIEEHNKLVLVVNYLASKNLTSGQYADIETQLIYDD